MLQMLGNVYRSRAVTSDGTIPHTGEGPYHDLGGGGRPFRRDALGLPPAGREALGELFKIGCFYNK